VSAWIDEGIVCYALAAGDLPDTMPVYRFRSSTLGSQFYTISELEKRALLDNYAEVWMYEGVAFYAFSEAVRPPGTLKVYRFWSGPLGHHLYTTNEAERDVLISNFSYVWQYEGIAWYAYSPQPTSSRGMETAWATSPKGLSTYRTHQETPLVLYP